jgi:hypothetical protein
MKNLAAKLFLVVFVFLSLNAARLAVAQEPPAERPPANVEGKWTIYAKDPNGRTSTKYVEIKQEGNKLSGHFKGPNQSGGIEGTINEQHILFRTKTRDVLTFRGRVEGNTIEGTFHARAGTGEWQGVRSN